MDARREEDGMCQDSAGVTNASAVSRDLQIPVPGTPILLHFLNHYLSTEVSKLNGVVL